MLPYIKHKQVAALVSPVEDKIKRESDEGTEEEYDPLESAAEELCNAIKEENYKAAASALRSAFELLDAQPHEEGPHTNG